MERLGDEPWILVVDDSPDDAGVVDRALRRAGRSERLKVCLRADEALKILGQAATLPGLILLNDRIAGMSSHDFLATLRRAPETAFLPIVILSGEWQARAVRQALASGANSFVIKTVDFDRHIDDLKSTFHYWLDVHRGPVPPFPRAEML